jgi:phospholipid/cholesterol/gamma-HCH transport system substrate-binding protein
VVIVELVAGKIDAPPLTVAAGAEVGVIHAQPSALQKLMNEGGDVLGRLTEALDHASRLLSEENLQRIGSTLTHIESISGQVDADKAELGNTLRHADAAFAKIDRAADDFIETVAAADQTLARADRMLEHDIAPATQDLKPTLAALRSLVARMDALLGRNSRHLDQFAAHGLTNLAVVLDDLRTLVVNLNKVVTRLDAAPADYLLQRDRPREYRRK